MRFWRFFFWGTQRNLSFLSLSSYEKYSTSSIKTPFHFIAMPASIFAFLSTFPARSTDSWRPAVPLSSLFPVPLFLLFLGSFFSSSCASPAKLPPRWLIQTFPSYSKELTMAHEMPFSLWQWFSGPNPDQLSGTDTALPKGHVPHPAVE